MGADITRDFFAQLIRGLQAILEKRLAVQEAVYKWLFQTVRGNLINYAKVLAL
jgi:hypothetical protein